MTDAAIGLRFSRKPSPVFPEHRPMYKISQLLLILYIASRGGRSRLPRLHLFNWALKTRERHSTLVEAAKQKKLTLAAWGFDPAFAIAIRYAIAEGLVREVSSAYELTERGHAVAKAVLADPDVLTEDKSALLAIGKGITETMVEDVAKGWES